MRKSFYLPGLLAFCFTLFSATVKAAPPIDTVYIVSSPVNDSVFPGYTAHFSVTAKDTPSAIAMNFAWQESTDGGASWSNYEFIGPTTDTTTTISVTPAIGSAGGNLYRCIVFNINGSDTSDAAMLVINAGNPPQFTVNPVDDTVCATAASVHFSVTAVDTAGSLPISYTWFESNGGPWDSVIHDFDTAHIHGYTTATLTLTGGAILTHSGYMFMAVAGNDSGMNASTAATLTVDIPEAGTITGAMAICRGTTSTLSSDVAGGVWSNLHPAIDTVDSFGNVYGIAPGNDTIIYTIHNTCGAISTAAFIHIDTILSNLPISGPDATCVGHIINLTNPNPGGVWSSTDTSVYVNSIGMVEGLFSGFATIHYTLSNVCNTADTTYDITIDTVLDHGTVSGPSTLCAGSWVNFTSSNPGGIWLSSNSSIAVVSASGNVTGISEGNAVISYIFSNACGASVATDTIHVSQLVSHIMGLDSVGVGFTRALTDSVPGGIWVSMNPSIATVDSTTGLVTGVAAGTTSIEYSTTNACGFSSASIVMHVGVTNAGAIRGLDTVCVGNTITLTDSIAGGIWTTASDTIATVDSFTGVVTGVARGLGHITYTVTNGFGSRSVTRNVFVNSTPVDSLVVPSIFALGGSYYFYGYPAGGTWHTSNTIVGNFIGSPGFFVIYGSGIDTITYSAPNRCGPPVDTSFIIVVPFAVGVNQVANNISVLNVYPNPSTGDFTVNIASGVNEQAVVTVTNMVGEKVKEITVTTNRSAELSIDQPDGVYFISTTTSTGKYSAKITITK